MLESSEEPLLVEGVSQWRIGGRCGVAFEGMLDGDLAAIELAHEGTHDGPRL